MNETDQQLIAGAVSGRTEAFDSLVIRYQDRLFNAIFRIVRDREEARDVVQEAFVTAWRKLTSFRGEAGFYSWLFRIAYNRAMSTARKKKPPGSTFPAGEGQLADQNQQNQPEYRLELHEQQQLIREALDRLPDDYRVVLVLKEIENLKYEQIAEILDVPLGTIRSRIHRARLLLREQLQRLLPEEQELAISSRSETEPSPPRPNA